MVCPVCGKTSFVNCTHFEKGKSPVRYARCKNPKCNAHITRRRLSYENVLQEVRNG